MDLAAWLERLEQLHPSAIDLGLARCGEVARRLDLVDTAVTTITVAGTNGKGSTVAVMEAILCARGERVGAFTSPHLVRYNERIRVEGAEVSDALIVEAFEAIEKARSDISLTYFEFNTLAALWIFKKLDVAFQLLEVGLGGRLDAVNIVDADVAVVTAIGLDHQEWLGSDVETIAIEKCGIARDGRACVVADSAAPVSVSTELQRIGACEVRALRDYAFGDTYFESPKAGSIAWSLPAGILPLNAAAGLRALECRWCWGHRRACCCGHEASCAQRDDESLFASVISILFLTLPTTLMPRWNSENSSIAKQLRKRRQPSLLSCPIKTAVI